MPAGRPGVIASPNIWRHPSTYELERRCFDPDGLVDAALRSIAGWTDNKQYNVGDIVGFNGGVFQCRQSHFSVKNAGWTPTAAASLWLGVTCGNGTQAPPAQQPPAQQPPAQQQPPAPPVVNQPPVNQNPSLPAQCSATGAPGPKFDPAGTKNVGNGHGGQFIGGQCLSNADCASGCCARPCGICSGPGAQFQAGKQGCGFPN